MTAQQGADAPSGASCASGSAMRGRLADEPAATEPEPAATEPEPSRGRLEAVQVREMFDRIAGVYDVLNTAMTAGLHHRWRSRAADLARVSPVSRVLDVATGTGDLAIELARRVYPGGG